MSSGLARGAQRGKCFVDLPVYDVRGARVPIKKVSIRLRGASEDIPKQRLDEVGMEYRDNRLYFDSKVIPTVVELRIDLQPDGLVRRTVGLAECESRASSQYGELHSGADVWGTGIQGRVKGCAIGEDWWVRIMPMHGGPDEWAFEGLVKKSGEFSVVGSVRGERHLLVFGRGREPLKVIAFDVTEGGKNDVWVVDLSGACPR
jgi:hypothetical protein